MSFARFEDLLKRTIGLDPASIGTSAVQRAVRARMRANGLDEIDAYGLRLSGSRAELQALIEAVIVPETWFFRDPQAFAATARLAVDAWPPRRAEGGRLRLLSLPCSTGEEPYTMAMALLDAGLPADAFAIDAVDISGPSLDQARRGVYGRNSFRGADLAFRSRHFARTASGYALSPAVRGCVRFRQGNLFADFGDGGPTYDYLFCRNLLIYFDPTDQRRAVAVLRRLLAPAGTLFVGHSETSLLIGQSFASAGITMAFAFRKSDAAAPPAVRRAVRSRPKPPPVAAFPASPPASLPRHDPAAELAAIRAAADRGDLAEALQHGEAYLRAHEATADALQLMGVVADAAGDLAAAIGYYRRALYLDPGRDETLAHLGLLLEKTGDAAGAGRTRERAQRLRARQGG